MDRTLVVGVLSGVFVGIVLIVLLVAFSDRLTDADTPIRIGGHVTASVDEFPHPTSVPPPTIRPTPHGHDPDSQPARLGVLYNSRADGITTDTSGARLIASYSMLDQLPVAGTPSNDGWIIHIPSCRHIGTYPMVRYVIGIPVRDGALMGVTIAGEQVLDEFITTSGDGGAPVVIGPESDPLWVYISRNQLSCEVVANQEMVAYGQR